MGSHDERRYNSADYRRVVWANGLKAEYDDVAQEPLPDAILNLLNQLEAAESRKR